MAYNSGDLILDDHYNLFITGTSNGTGNHNVANVNSVNGSGFGDKGYGQTGNLSPVSAGVIVSATQWASMFTTIGKLASHQGSTVGPEPLPVGGDIIEAVAVLTTDINEIYDNRFNASALGISTSLQTQRTIQWNQIVTMTQSVTFTSNDTMRYFFNAGGLIRVEFDRAGGSVSSKNTSWTDLCNAGGAITLSSTGILKIIAGQSYNGTTKIGGSGTINTIASGTGLHQLSTSDVLLFRQYQTSTYSSNRIDVYARVNTNVLTITTSYHDDGGGLPDDYVDGTLTTGLTAYHPSTTHLTNGWGTPTLSGSQSGS